MAMLNNQRVYQKVDAGFITNVPLHIFTMVLTHRFLMCSMVDYHHLRIPCFFHVGYHLIFDSQELIDIWTWDWPKAQWPFGGGMPGGPGGKTTSG